MQRVPSFQQSGDLRELASGQDAFDNGSKEVQRLAAEKIHRPDGFEKQCGRCSHPASHDRVGDPVEEGEVVRREGLLFSTQRKGMAETLAEIFNATG